MNGDGKADRVSPVSYARRLSDDIGGRFALVGPVLITACEGGVISDQDEAAKMLTDQVENYRSVAKN
jgi:hypothetical protein